MYEKIYDEINGQFFDNELERPIFLMGRHDAAVGGYFIPAAWTDSKDPSKSFAELCINVHLLKQENIEQFIMVLFHEMLHQYQFTIDPGHKGGVHDTEYVEMGESAGLKTLIHDPETTMATGEVIKGGKLEQFIQDWMERATAEDFIKATPKDIIPVDPRKAAQPMPGQGGQPGQPGQPGGQGQGQGQQGQGQQGQGGGQGQGEGQAQGSLPGQGQQGQGQGRKGGGRGPGSPQEGAQGVDGGLGSGMPLGGPAEPGKGQRRGVWEKEEALKRDPGMDTIYICPVCGEKVYGARGLRILCIAHSMRMVEAH